MLEFFLWGGLVVNLLWHLFAWALVISILLTPIPRYRWRTNHIDEEQADIPHKNIDVEIMVVAHLINLGLSSFCLSLLGYFAFR